MMDINMNLTFPIADWVMGTSDLNRGLLGHVFNGYDEAYIKPELRQAIAKHTHKQPPLTQQPA
jgi:DNA-binding transcriptional MocR family regulator